VLFEVATMAPGFTADEKLDDLGRALKLPPWEEQHRADIEAALAPVRVPAQGDSCAP
jgi:glyoxalase family protein